MKRTKDRKLFVAKVVLWICCVIFIGLLGYGIATSEKEVASIKYQVTRGLHGVSIRVHYASGSDWYKYGGYMNNAMIEVAGAGKIKVSLGSETEIIPVSDSPIIIDRIEPIHKFYHSGGLFFDGPSVKSDKILEYVIKVNYQNTPTQEPTQEQ